MTTPGLAPPPVIGAPASEVLGSPTGALVRRAFLDARLRTLAFAYIFAVYSWLQAAGYHRAYPTLTERMAFARSFAGNDAIRLFYGYPYDVVTVGGYSAWRVGGSLALAASAYGVLAAVRAGRAEEEAGRAEMVLAGVVRRRMAFGSSLAAIGLGAAVLWLAEWAGFLIGGLPATSSAFLALGTGSVVVVFVGVGTLAGQLAGTRRVALSLGAAAAVGAWLLRVVSDIEHGAAWLRWATPLGWAELLRPFAGSRPWVLVLPLAATVLLLWVSARLAVIRDIGSGLLRERDARPASYRWLGRPSALAFRNQRGVLTVWIAGLAGLALVLGAVASSVSAAGISPSMQKEIARFGAGSIATPTGYLSFVFMIFIFATTLFACSQMAAARQEESDQQLETLLAQPVGRTRWLTGRLSITVAATAALSALAGLLTWTGAASQGVDASLPRLLEAGANCLPVSLMVLGWSALAYAVVPRVSAAVSYSAVSALFLWYLVGSALGLPKWVVGLTPFEHIGLVPTEKFRVGAALLMLVIGAVGTAGALLIFRRRDLLGP